jgi:hypothetical protein
VLLGQVTRDDAQQKEKEYSSADGLIAITRAGENKFDVKFYPKIDHRLEDDIAKQILTMLTTILAAMIGFYFGGARPVGPDVKAPPVVPGPNAAPVVPDPNAPPVVPDPNAPPVIPDPNAPPVIPDRKAPPVIPDRKAPGDPDPNAPPVVPDPNAPPVVPDRKAPGGDAIPDSSD